ncbi:hypothetical protein PF007_g31049 [Phytophthora fragariae]|uniref:Uncharacterized protein n=1 Tax=Phytophthora fragariae TaxID=53985 RepID=A0A6A3PSR5_9STRA|nr:hypothetical protein PF007_g31049 [Phytophthora fragariae]
MRAVVCEAATNSDSIVESATHACFLHIHATKAPAIITTPPLTDFLSFLSAA